MSLTLLQHKLIVFKIKCNSPILCVHWVLLQLDNCGLMVVYCTQWSAAARRSDKASETVQPSGWLGHSLPQSHHLQGESHITQLDDPLLAGHAIPQLDDPSQLVTQSHNWTIPPSWSRNPTIGRSLFAGHGIHP